MAYEFRSSVGVVRLVQHREGWSVELGGERAGLWPSAEAAVAAVEGRRSGLPILDGTSGLLSDADLGDWTPLGENI